MAHTNENNHIQDNNKIVSQDSNFSPKSWLLFSSHIFYAYISLTYLKLLIWIGLLEESMELEKSRKR